MCLYLLVADVIAYVNVKCVHLHIWACMCACMCACAFVKMHFFVSSIIYDPKSSTNEKDSIDVFKQFSAETSIVSCHKII